MMTQEFTPDQVLSHNKKGDLYLIIRNKVYDVSDFVEEHPGGEELLLDVAGQDATEPYDDAGHSDEANEILEDLFKGQLRPATNGVEKPQAGDALKSTAGHVTPKATKIVDNVVRSATGVPQIFLTSDSFRETQLIQKEVISHNVAIYRFKLGTPNSILGLPIGQHISIGANLLQPDGTIKEIIKSYTPISNDNELGSFRLLIKSYPTGNISKHIGLLNVGDSIRVRGPKGAFSYMPNMVRHFGMVAGGTGITPMLQIIEAVLRGRADGDKTDIDLIFANVSVEDILVKEHLDGLAQGNSGFRVQYVLDKPPEGWTGGVGYVTADMLSKWLPEPASDVKILLCGPPPMVSKLKKATEALGFEKARPVSKLGDQVFSF